MTLAIISDLPRRLRHSRSTAQPGSEAGTRTANGRWTGRKENTMSSDGRYASFMGHGPRQIPHWEHGSCPDSETGRMSGGYMMCIGNHIPFNVPGEAIKRYLDLSQELAHR